MGILLPSHNRKLYHIYMNNQALALFGFMTLLGFITMIALSGAISMDIGCHVIGTEVNGDYSTEYLTIGNC